MSLKDLEQFRQKEPTPEPVSAQAEDATALEREKRIAQIEEELSLVYFPSIQKYGTMIFDILEAEGVSDSLVPYVLRELAENPRYSAKDLFELLEEEHGKRNLSLLDLAIENAKRIKREDDRRKQKGIITAVSPTICSPSASETQDSLTPKQIARYDENGTPHDISTEPGIFWFLRLAFDVVTKNGIQDGFITLDINGIAKSLGYQDLRELAKDKSLTQEEARQSIISQIEKSFLGVRGAIPEEGGSTYQVMNFDHENRADGTLVFSSPYINRQLKKHPLSPQIENKTQAHRGYHFLIKSSALRFDPSGIVLEMADKICIKLSQAGVKNSYHTTLKSLLDKCPLALAKLEAAKTASHRLKILKKLVKDLNTLLTKHTAILETYQNAEIIVPQAVSFRTLGESQIFIRHEGKKANRDAPKRLC